MMELWDYTQTSSGPYVGLWAKWFSNVAIPETHDCLAVKTTATADSRREIVVSPPGGVLAEERESGALHQSRSFSMVRSS